MQPPRVDRLPANRRPWKQPSVDCVSGTMGPEGGPEASSSHPPKLVAFKKLLASYGKRKMNESRHEFVKKLDCIPIVALPAEETCRSALNLADRGLIGQFIGLWPSPKTVNAWV